MGRRRSRTLTGRPWAALLLTAFSLWATGCQLIGGADPPPPTLGAGQGVVYQGSLILDGGDIPGAIELIKTGGRVRVALQTASGLEADGEGRRRGRNLTVQLTYGGDCPGTMSLAGEWDEEAMTFQGTVTAADCTGPASGTFSFSGG